MAPRTPITQSQLNNALEEQGLKWISNEKNLVGWAPMNSRHPRNWSWQRKAYDATLIILLEFYTTAVSTSGATAAHNAQENFGTGRIMSLFIYVSTYLIAQGLGNIVFPPFSECYGRKWLYVITTVIYSAFCVLISASGSLAGGAVGRLITGFLSAVPSTVISGSMEDMFDSKARIWLTLPWTASAQLGIATGPVMSAYITAAWGWEWIFYISAIVTGTLAALMLTMRESRPTLLLAKEVKHLRRITGNEFLEALNPDRVPDAQSFVRDFAFRPVQLIFTEPIIAAASVVIGFSSGLTYLFTDILSSVYMSLGMSSKEASLPFLALGLGFLPCIGFRSLEWHKAARRARKGQPDLPEDKLTGFIIAALVMMGSLWWFAWTIPPAVHVHYFASVVPLFLIGVATIESGTVLVGYLADSYRSYAGTGFAAISVVKCVLAASFPLFSRRMFNVLGPNVFVSVLAALAIIFCIMAPMLRVYGERLRKRSKFASYSVNVENEVVMDRY